MSENDVIINGWNKNEIERLEKMISLLSEVVNLALDCTLKFDSEKGVVIFLNESGRSVREINIKEDSCFGALKDIVDSLG